MMLVREKGGGKRGLLALSGTGGGTGFCTESAAAGRGFPCEVFVRRGRPIQPEQLGSPQRHGTSWGGGDCGK